MGPRGQPEDPDPPSTYPGIWKKPSGFGQPFRSGYDWMESKRNDDDIGPLWRVHDKLYDLTPFISKHPGGSDWLILTQGTDITEAFETHHILNVSLVEATLAKYFVKEAKTRRNSPYTFEENGFFKTLKRRIAPVLKEKGGTGPTFTFSLIQDSLVLSFLATMVLGTWLNSTGLKALSGLFLAMQLIAAHNFFHLKDNWRKYYFDLSMYSHHEWRITHALSHHLFPNTLLDIELELFPFYQFLPNRPKTWFQRFGPPVFSHLLYLLGFWLDLGKRIYKVAKGRQSLRIENAIVFLELFVLMEIAGLKEGLWSWVFIHSVASFIFLTQGANAAHHSPEQFHDGDEPRSDPDFGLCQLDSTCERAGELHTNPFVILVTFGEHCLHHLFPSICHSKLISLRAVFAETVQEFGEKVPKFGQWDLYLGTFQQLARTEVRSGKFGKKKGK